MGNDHLDVNLVVEGYGTVSRVGDGPKGKLGGGGSVDGQGIGLGKELGTNVATLAQVNRSNVKDKVRVGKGDVKSPEQGCTLGQNHGRNKGGGLADGKVAKAGE